MEFEIPKSEDEVVAAVDATGIKVTNRGEWLRKYHKGKRRGWIKIHIAVDVESKELLSIEVTDEKTGDSEVFEELVDDLDLEDCLADGTYDSENIFEILEEKEVRTLQLGDEHPKETKKRRTKTGTKLEMEIFINIYATQQLFGKILRTKTHTEVEAKINKSFQHKKKFEKVK